MSFRKMLADLHPEFKRKYASNQYSLAQKIIGKKLSLKINQPMMASLMALSYDKYLDMESGSVDVSVEDYELALEKVADLTRVDMDSRLTEAISKFPSYVMKPAEEPKEKAVLFNNQYTHLEELIWSYGKEGYPANHLKKELGSMKNLKLGNLNLFFDEESTERDLLVNEMINKLNGKSTEDVGKHSIELKEVFSDKIPLFA